MEEEEEEKRKTEEGKDGSSEVVRWERFLPRMVLSVLLVEADDSTRHIISALLRKCSYRVAAVSDGLMAWEILRDRPHTIDLILTEVELPSISGFALLTLVMEHEVCKNIPVIMMSSHDSISMVLKCMLKGAADFLLKPVRKNELRNLWQHVWRRYMLSGGHVPQNLPTAQYKIEDIAENDAETSRSSDYASSSQKTRDESEKGSDTQGLSLLNSTVFDTRSTRTEPQEKGFKLSERSFHLETQTKERSDGLGTDALYGSKLYKSNPLKLEQGHAFTEKLHQGECGRLETDRQNGSPVWGRGCKDELVGPPTRVIDLISSFDDRTKSTSGRSTLIDGTSEFAPPLELSLRRPSAHQIATERHTLNHSDASAFSWYNNNKTLQPLFPTLPGNCNNVLKEPGSKSHEKFSSPPADNALGSSQPRVTLSDSRENMTTVAPGQSGDSELTIPSEVGLIAVQGVSYGQVFPTMVYGQSGLPSQWSPKAGGKRERPPLLRSTSVHSNPDMYDSEKGHHRSEETNNCSTDRTVCEQSNQKPVREHRCGSPAAGQSASSSLCNGITNHEKNTGCEVASSKIDGNACLASVTDGTTMLDGFSDSNFFIQDGPKGMYSHRSSQREAALTKFRLKRKDRCFEKKVRYHSRKKLAEQRPRVRGQFVRQAQSEVPVGDANGHTTG